MEDLFSLNGNTAIVTGAANGIGKAIVEGLHQYGAEVVCIDVADAVHDVAKEFGGKKPEVHAVKGDLSDRRDLERCFGEALGKLQKLDILVNAAGILVNAPSVEFPMSGWDKTIEINLTAVFEMCKLAGKVMIPQGRGKIVNIGSYNSIAGTARLPAYCASKGGVKLLTMTLASEWASSGVFVNTIAPGYVETALSKLLRNDAQGYAKSLETIPLGRWGQPEDIVGATVFLASRASDYITGITLVVDGGRLAM